MIIDLSYDKLFVSIEVDEEGRVLLRNFSRSDITNTVVLKKPEYMSIIELHISGENQDDHHGAKHSVTYGASCLRYVSHGFTDTIDGRHVKILLTDGRMNVTVNYRFYNGISTVRAWSEVENVSGEALGMEYLTSFSYVGVDGGEVISENSPTVYLPHNSVVKEVDWRAYTPAELGFFYPISSASKRLLISNSGTWSTKEFLPMGAVVNSEAGTAYMWQIESNGSWNYELSELSGHFSLKLSGPSEADNHWYKELASGESFVSVPVAVSVGCDFDDALAEMTRYRRKIIDNNKENAVLPIIFNDYMNCLWADPTEEKMIPVIDRAAETGAEYYCMDAGWYADGTWWEAVGEWQPVGWRFPNGIKKVFDYIRSKGMIPGIWLEPESMGIQCPLAKEWEDQCFFIRHGKRVIDHGRYQLDFRHPRVRAHLDKVVDRLVNDYGAGYFKFDYNIDGGIGTEVDADSFGDGLLAHNRAYLDWLRSIKQRYPALIIEVCSSGGQRMDYAMLSVGHLQSVSDQSKYDRNSYVASAASTAVLPEQGAIWTYPMADADCDNVAMNMINSMLGRIHLSGNINGISDDGFELIKEALRCYKSYRDDIPSSVPTYPLGLPTYGDEFLSFGLKCDSVTRMAVIRMNTENDEVVIPMQDFSSVKVIYPSSTRATIKKLEGGFSVKLPSALSAVLLEIK